MPTQSASDLNLITQKKAVISKKGPNSEVSLILHTAIAQSLLRGSWDYKNMGLLQFSKLMQTLWEAAKEEDPYAEWYLMKIYDQINQLKEEIKKVENNCQEKLTQLRGLEVQLFNPEKTKKFPLHFFTPFGYMGAYLIADLDYVFRQAAVLKQLGILLELNQTPAYFARKTHELFAHARKWQYTGVTRKDITENNQRAQKAKEFMGEIPAVVLKKEVRFMFLPKVVKKRKDDLLLEK